eukprot:g1809.t1
MCQNVTSGNRVLACSFIPGDAGRVVVAGKSHLTFFSRASGSTMHSQRGMFGKRLAGSISITCTAYTHETLLVCGSNLGHICVWDYTAGTAMLPMGSGSIANAHAGSINCIEAFHNLVITGGKDATIRIWQGKGIALNLLRELSPHAKISQDPSIRSVSMSFDRKSLIFGTRASEVYRVNLSSGEIPHNRPLLEGHFRGELWGVAVHPLNPHIFATCGGEALVKVWNTRRKAALLTSKPGVLPGPTRCLAYHAGGRQLAVGLGGQSRLRRKGGEGGERSDGTIVILDAQNALEPITYLRISEEMISDVKYTTDGAHLVAGSHDGTIYIFKVIGESYQLVHQCKGHSSYVTRLDVSIDGNWIRSNDGAYELLYWDLQKGQQMTDLKVMQTVRWNTTTCTCSWPTPGIWPHTSDGTDVNAVSLYSTTQRSDGDLYDGILASADDYGKVKVFKSPSRDWGAAFYEHRGHSSHVTNLAFTVDGKRLISVGGADRCVFQWLVVPAN